MNIPYPGSPQDPAGGYGQPYGQGYGYGYGSGPQLAYGSFGARFLAVFVDGILLSIPFRIIGAVTGATLAMSLLQLVAAVVYVAVLEGGPTGQTVGRKLVNLRVVDANTGQPGIGPGRAIGRYFAKFLSAVVLLLGFFWMLWDPRKQTWHDKLVGTVVVKT